MKAFYWGGFPKQEHMIEIMALMVGAMSTEPKKAATKRCCVEKALESILRA